MRQVSIGSGGAITEWAEFDRVLRESGAVYVAELDATVEVDLTELAQIGLPLPPRLPTCTELHEMGIADMGVEPAHHERTERETVRVRRAA